MANYTYRVATMNDAAQITTFCNEHFTPHEPINVALGTLIRDYKESLEKTVSLCFFL